MIELFSFLLTIVILVIVHEWGHYIVAKKLGIKILRFSVGFGSPIWTKKSGADQTEFVIAPIPLGGYVKMLDEREGEVPPDQVHRAFNRQKLWVRSAVVFAGPGINFVFAILAFAAMFMYGIPTLKPVLGDILNDTPAARAGLKADDIIVSVNGEAVKSWEQTLQQTATAVLDAQPIVWEVEDEHGYKRRASFELGLSADDLTQGDLLEKIGVQRGSPKIPPVLAEITPQSPAAQAHLLEGDTILAIHDQPVKMWEEVGKLINENGDKPLTIKILRKSQTLTLEVKPAYNDQAKRYLIGIKPAHPSKHIDRYVEMEQYGIVAALQKGLDKTWEITVLTLKVLSKIVTFEMSPTKNLGGPVTLAKQAGSAFNQGGVIFLYFLGFVSANLAIFNLLPVPILDGGHLLTYALEAIKGSPLSETTLDIMQKVGLSLIGLLFSFAILGDMTRLFG
ncbi:MAG: metalloprotease RseP [Pseudomonadota bacterium]|jgi:regulator of sigma E protease